jgi:hypothetical protein
MQHLDAVIDQAMSLPYDTRLTMIDIVRKRTIEEERSRIAEQARLADQEFASGKMMCGSAEDLARYLENDND